MTITELKAEFALIDAKSKKYPQLLELKQFVEQLQSEDQFLDRDTRFAIIEKLAHIKKLKPLHALTKKILGANHKVLIAIYQLLAKKALLNQTQAANIETHKDPKSLYEAIKSIKHLGLLTELTLQKAQQLTIAETHLEALSTLKKANNATDENIVAVMQVSYKSNSLAKNLNRLKKYTNNLPSYRQIFNGKYSLSYSKKIDILKSLFKLKLNTPNYYHAALLLASTFSSILDQVASAINLLKTCKKIFESNPNELDDIVDKICHSQLDCSILKHLAYFHQHKVLTDQIKFTLLQNRKYAGESHNSSLHYAAQQLKTARQLTKENLEFYSQYNYPDNLVSLFTLLAKHHMLTDTIRNAALSQPHHFNYFDSSLIYLKQLDLLTEENILAIIPRTNLYEIDRALKILSDKKFLADEAKNLLTHPLANDLAYIFNKYYEISLKNLAFSISAEGMRILISCNDIDNLKSVMDTINHAFRYNNSKLDEAQLAYLATTDKLPHLKVALNRLQIEHLLTIDNFYKIKSCGRIDNISKIIKLAASHNFLNKDSFDKIIEFKEVFENDTLIARISQIEVFITHERLNQLFLLCQNAANAELAVQAGICQERCRLKYLSSPAIA